MIVADMAVGVCIRLGNGGGVVVGGLFVADAVGVRGISVALVWISVVFVDSPHLLVSKIPMKIEYFVSWLSHCKFI